MALAATTFRKILAFFNVPLVPTISENDLSRNLLRSSCDLLESRERSQLIDIEIDYAFRGNSFVAKSLEKAL